jgi:hypothetical protein
MLELRHKIIIKTETEIIIVNNSVHNKITRGIYNQHKTK